MRGGNGFFDGYNPFDLYEGAERARGKPLPPHLVFAELDPGDSYDACAFLDAYGPLEATNDVRLLSAKELKLWKKLASMSRSPEEHFRAMLGEVPLLADPPAPRNDFHSYPRALFWKEQSDFELVLRLRAALDQGTGQVQKIQRILKAKGVRWDLKGRNIERRYIECAREFVINAMNSRLRTMQPRVARLPNSGKVTGVWGCYSLLEAMYLMLFLDIASWWSGRISQCEKCHRLFYTALERGKYCSPLCENRARALRAYHNRAARNGQPTVNTVSSLKRAATREARQKTPVGRRKRVGLHG